MVSVDGERIIKVIDFKPGWSRKHISINCEDGKLGVGTMCIDFNFEGGSEPYDPLQQNLLGDAVKVVSVLPNSKFQVGDWICHLSVEKYYVKLAHITTIRQWLSKPTKKLGITILRSKNPSSLTKKEHAILSHYQCKIKEKQKAWNDRPLPPLSTKKRLINDNDGEGYSKHNNNNNNNIDVNDNAVASIPTLADENFYNHNQESYSNDDNEDEHFYNHNQESYSNDDIDVAVASAIDAIAIDDGDLKPAAKVIQKHNNNEVNDDNHKNNSEDDNFNNEDNFHDDNQLLRNAVASFPTDDNEYSYDSLNNNHKTNNDDNNDNTNDNTNNGDENDDNDDDDASDPIRNIHFQGNREKLFYLLYKGCDGNGDLCNTCRIHLVEKVQEYFVEGCPNHQIINEIMLSWNYQHTLRCGRHAIGGQRVRIGEINQIDRYLDFHRSMMYIVCKMVDAGRDTTTQAYYENTEEGLRDGVIYTARSRVPFDIRFYYNLFSRDFTQLENFPDELRHCLYDPGHWNCDGRKKYWIDKCGKGDQQVFDPTEIFDQINEYYPLDKYHLDPTAVFELVDNIDHDGIPEIHFFWKPECHYKNCEREINWGSLYCYRHDVNDNDDNVERVSLSKFGRETCNWPGGCDNVVRSKGLCGKHGGRQTCNWPGGCENIAQSKGLCDKHGVRETCNWPGGCENIAQSKGLCGKHGGRETCNWPGGCDKPVRSKGLCGKHGGRETCNWPGGCDKPVRSKGLCGKHGGIATCNWPGGCDKPVRSKGRCKNHFDSDAAIT